MTETITPAKLHTPPDLTWVGKSLVRKEDERLVRGLGRFVDDRELPGMLHMAVARCPFPHARIRDIHVSAAVRIPGVEGVLLGADVVARTSPIPVLRPLPDARVPAYRAMASDVARFEGEPVVSVVASDRAVAEDAIGEIEIEWDPLPAVMDAERALEPDAPLLHPELGTNLLAANPRSAGNVESALSAADVVISDRIRINRVTGLPMEGRAVVADYTRGVGTLDVWSSTQLPHLVRWQLARVLGISESKIRVIAYDVGGGFGLKLGLYPEEVLACLHSMDSGRPVKWVEDRLEHFRMTTHAREAVHRIEIGATRDGSISGMRDVYVVDAGAYNSPFGSPMLSSLMFTGPYRVEDAFVERRVALTNKVPVGAYRGYGQPESNFVRETMIDRLARALAMDPVELRRRNLLRPGDLPWKTPGGAVYDSGDYVAALDRALELVGADAVRERQRDPRRRGRRIGLGVACFVEMTGYPGSAFLGKHGAAFGAHESVTIRMNRDGGCDLYTAVSHFGQATETSFAQVAASALGMHPDRVIVHSGDTGSAPHNTGSFASRTTVAGTGAVLAAAGQVRQKALRVAAYLLERNAATLEIVDGIVRDVDDPGVSLPLADVATAAITGHRLPPGDSPGLESTVYFDPPANTFGYGTAAAVVEVDPRSGEFAVERFVLVHDCGTEINPTIVKGQILGGLAQGFGAALFEELVYDPDSGQLMTGTMVDYLMPTAADLPLFEVDHTEVPSPVTPLGVRGVGEAGTIPVAASIANAICDALWPLPIAIRRLPLTPERVWRAIREAEGSPGAGIPHSNEGAVT